MRRLCAILADYISTPTNVLLTVACTLAWIVLFTTVVGVYFSIRERVVIIHSECPPCGQIRLQR